MLKAGKALAALAKPSSAEAVLRKPMLSYLQWFLYPPSPKGRSRDAKIKGRTGQEHRTAGLGSFYYERCIPNSCTRLACGDEDQYYTGRERKGVIVGCRARKHVDRADPRFQNRGFCGLVQFISRRTIVPDLPNYAASQCRSYMHRISLRAWEGPLPLLSACLLGWLVHFVSCCVRPN